MLCFKGADTFLRFLLAWYNSHHNTMSPIVHHWNTDIKTMYASYSDQDSETFTKHHDDTKCTIRVLMFEFQWRMNVIECNIKKKSRIQKYWWQSMLCCCHWYKHSMTIGITMIAINVSMFHHQPNLRHRYVYSVTCSIIVSDIYVVVCHWTQNGVSSFLHSMSRRRNTDNKTLRKCPRPWHFCFRLKTAKLAEFPKPATRGLPYFDLKPLSIHKCRSRFQPQDSGSAFLSEYWFNFPPKVLPISGNFWPRVLGLKSWLALSRFVENQEIDVL